jgi:hypothetical protein
VKERSRKRNMIKKVNKEGNKLILYLLNDIPSTTKSEMY